MHIFATRLPATLTITILLYLVTLVLSVPIAEGVAYVCAARSPTT